LEGKKNRYKSIALIFVGILIFLSLYFSFVGIPLDSSPTKKASNHLTFHPHEGTWGLTNYFDSIIAHKKLAHFRLQTPTWFGIFLNITKDSIEAFGSMTNPIKTKLLFNQDTICTFKTSTPHAHWTLLNNNSTLLLQQVSNDYNNIDTTIYIYRRRKDLIPLLNKSDYPHPNGKKISEYFNKQLLAGVYTNKETNLNVIFYPNGTIEGLDSFTNYNIENYFGTYHPHNNFDVLQLSNHIENYPKDYNWVFSDSILRLTAFVPKMTKRNGKLVHDESWIPGNNTIVLIRQ